MWIVFEKDYCFRPAHYRGYHAIYFKAGKIEFVNSECKERAITRKAAREATLEEIEHARGR